MTVDKEREHCEEVLDGWSYATAGVRGFQKDEELIALLIRERAAVRAEFKARALEAIEKYDGSKCSGVYDAVEALK